jgi:2-aminoethylphosphonate-pyruvate transaminase
MDRDRILLTPGPLTTTLRTKLAMLHDWGSWDADFNAVTAGVRHRLLDIVHGHGTHVVVPLQGSGTFSVEAAVATVVPKDGHVLVLDNGAYCKRAGKLTQMMGRRVTTVAFAEDAPVSPAVLDDHLRTDASITHVVLIHCETGAGVENPLADVAAVCERHGKGLIVDAMSSFAALPIDARTVRFDALIAASGKCLEGVPGMGFVFVRKAVLDGCAGHSQSLAMDLHDQHQYMEKTGQWRFTPPTHVVVALAEAITQFVEEGGQPARLARYAANCATLVDGHAPAGPAALPEARAPGADHRHLPCAGTPGLRLPALLPGGQAARLHALSGQADARWTPSASAASVPSAAWRCSRPSTPWARRCARWALRAGSRRLEAHRLRSRPHAAAG